MLGSSHVTDARRDNLRSTTTWQVALNGSGTKLEIVSEYKIASAVLRTIAMPVLAEINQAEAKTITANVNAVLEAR